MATLGELMEKFASAAEEEPAAPNPEPAITGHEKTASGGEGMKSLTDIYLQLAETDLEKEASVTAQVPDQEADFAKMAEQIAEAEAAEVVSSQADDQVDIVKVAAEYDAAGRIMARGFFAEFNKLAGNMDTEVTPNQDVDSESKAQTPALGERGLPTVETNFAGSENHDQKMDTTGPGPKQVYKESLKPSGSIAAGATKDDPEALAEQLGGGSVGGGFATVKDLVNSQGA